VAASDAGDEGPGARLDQRVAGALRDSGVLVQDSPRHERIKALEEAVRRLESLRKENDASLAVVGKAERMRETAAEWKAMKAESLSLGERIAARSVLLAKAEEAVREAEASLPEGSVSKAYGLAEALRGHWGRITSLLEERYPHVLPGSWRSELSLLEREGMSLRSLEDRKAAIDRRLAAEGSSPLSAAARALSSAKRAVEALAPARSPSPQERGASASRSVRPGVGTGMGL